MKNSENKEIVYIAGPITGIIGYAEHFRVAQAKLEAKGYIVINPSILPEGLKDYMQICYAMIDQANIICFLNGWENSWGSCLERAHGIKTKQRFMLESDI